MSWPRSCSTGSSSDRVALSRRQTEADRVDRRIARRPPRARAATCGTTARPPPDRPWRLDPVPLVLDGSTFDELAAAVAERMRAIEAAARRPLRPAARSSATGWVPAEALARSRRYRLATVGTPPPPRWLTTYAVDVVALADGSWRIVQDLTDTPTGVGYALLDRSVMAPRGRRAARAARAPATWPRSAGSRPSCATR